LDQWGYADVSDTVVLLVSEMVTNAVLHARSPSELVIRLDAPRLRVEVHDGSGRAPTRKNYAEDAGTGRGMMIVENLASAWGVDLRDAGKVVWFELDPVRPKGAGAASATIDLFDVLSERPGRTGAIHGSERRPRCRGRWLAQSSR
jgi:hypothetical protein